MWRTNRRAINAKIIRVVRKSTERVAGGWFVSHEYDFSINCTTWFVLLLINYTYFVIKKYNNTKTTFLSRQYLVNSSYNLKLLKSTVTWLPQFIIYILIEDWLALNSDFQWLWARAHLQLTKVAINAHIELILASETVVFVIDYRRYIINKITALLS